MYRVWNHIFLATVVELYTVCIGRHIHACEATVAVFEREREKDDIWKMFNHAYNTMVKINKLVGWGLWWCDGEYITMGTLQIINDMTHLHAQHLPRPAS